MAGQYIGNSIESLRTYTGKKLEHKSLQRVRPTPTSNEIGGRDVNNAIGLQILGRLANSGEGYVPSLFKRSNPKRIVSDRERK